MSSHGTEVKGKQLAGNREVRVKAKMENAYNNAEIDRSHIT